MFFLEGPLQWKTHTNANTNTKTKKNTMTKTEELQQIITAMPRRCQQTMFSLGPPDNEIHTNTNTKTRKNTMTMTKKTSMQSMQCNVQKLQQVKFFLGLQRLGGPLPYNVSYSAMQVGQSDNFNSNIHGESLTFYLAFHCSNMCAIRCNRLHLFLITGQ